MDQIVDECRLFGMLRNSLRDDLVSSHGFSYPEAGAILNWFSPDNPEYLEHVDAWQRWLCSSVSTEAVLPILSYTKNEFGYHDITRIPWNQIGAIHQVAKLFYKWHGTPRRETNMQEVKQRLSEPLPLRLEQFELEGIRRHLIGVTPPDPDCLCGRFGPGATYEGYNAVDKWARKGAIPDVPPSIFRVNSRDPKVFRYFGDGITKIAEVPKSIKSNRIVSSEPAMYMYAQLGVNASIMAQMHQLWPQHISLDDQERHNQALLWDTACSIDLSDASDHVSISLVQAVLPQLWPVLAKVRSTYSQFPDGECVLLSTFAPMGSGVCFSTMTLVIAGILLYAADVIRKERHVKTWFHVYGDDIIVPVVMYDFVVDLLARAGLVVNRSKSCCTLIYRESCGREMYYGHDITPGYVRDPLDRVDASKIEQLASRLHACGFPSTARSIAELSKPMKFLRWNRSLQRMEACVRTSSARQKISTLDGWDGLNRWFAIKSEGNTFDEHRPSGVASEVWTKPAWRLRSCQDYPYLSTWFVTSRG